MYRLLITQDKRDHFTVKYFREILTVIHVLLATSTYGKNSSHMFEVQTLNVVYCSSIPRLGYVDDYLGIKQSCMIKSE